MPTATDEVYYDPYDVDINADPCPVYAWLRDKTDENLRTEPGQPMKIKQEEVASGAMFADLHYCLGANLARPEGRVALNEFLNRIPEWDVDLDDARLAPTTTVRGWERLPITPA